MNGFVQHNTRHLQRTLKERMTAMSAARRAVRAPSWSAEAIMNEALAIGLDVLEAKNGSHGSLWVEDWEQVRGDEDV